MTTLLILLGSIFVVNFMYIFVKAFQQQNVIHGNWLLIIPCSIIMGYIEVFITSQVAAHGFTHSFALAIGLGGGIGCMCSMWVHRRLTTINIYLRSLWIFHLEKYFKRYPF